MIEVALARGQPLVDGQAIFADEMSDDDVAVADRLAGIGDKRELAARRRRRVENVLVAERHVAQPQNGEDLQAVTVVVGHAEQSEDRNRA